MDLLADFLHFGASDILCKNPFKKCFKIVFFSLWRRDPVLELQFPTPLCVVLLCMFCNSVSADRIVMAASRSLKEVSHEMRFGASDFPSKNPFKKCFKIVIFSLWRRDPVLELQFPTPLRIVLLCFATQSLQIAL